jgi:acetoin utilization deacetylase AcuC-like enzyme
MIHIAWSNLYTLPLPEGHRFPMAKYELLHEQLVRENVVIPEQFFEPEEANLKTVLLTHSPAYVEKLLQLALSEKEIRAVGFPLTNELVKREFVLVQGTITCAEYAIKNGAALNIAGGTHHAFTNKGEGFCLLNDNAVAANYLLHRQQAKRIFIVDLDVHQGNGTAEIFSNDSRVFTFSMHGKENYPLRKETSDLDIELATNTTGEKYMQILAEQLNKIMRLFSPDFIFYNSGVDVLATDKYGKLLLTTEECMERDRLVFNLAVQHSVPIVTSMGGGYSPRIGDIVNAHCNTFRTACELFQ